MIVRLMIHRSKFCNIFLALYSISLSLSFSRRCCFFTACNFVLIDGGWKLTKCNVSSSLRARAAHRTHTHTHILVHIVKWANFPRPNAASPSPYSLSPIGFFYTSKFLVSQPATIWSVVVPILDSRSGQGSKADTRWWRGGWRWKTEPN